MNILFLGLDHSGHLPACSELKKALTKAEHVVVHLKYRFDELSPTDLTSWLARFQSKIEEQIDLFSPYLASGKFDLLLSELPIFAAVELKAKFKLPWVVFNALPLIFPIKNADLFLQASIPEFENWFDYENVRYVGFFLEKLGVPIEKTFKTRPIIHVTQGTIANKDDSLIQTTKEALKDSLFACHNEYLLVAEPISHKIWMSSFDLFITNGGFGGVSQAIYHGVPIICAGETEDKPIVGEKIEKARIGVNLRTAKPTKAQISEAISFCLADLKIQENCKRLSRIAKSYSYQKAVNLIENLRA